MKILVLNCGSSSLKYQLLDMENESLLAKGTYERIGEKSFLTHKVNGEKIRIEKPVKNHTEAIEVMIEQLLNPKYHTIESLDEIEAIGHRIVHGADLFDDAALVTEEVISDIQKCAELAPIHNPAAILGIRAAQEVMKQKPNVVVFDTAFHQTIPEKAYIYPIPYSFYQKYKIRKYGAHGTSHSYVSKRVAEIMKKPVEDLKIVVCHLGQGASLCAVKDGKSIDTTMGLTPLGGIPMCARSGDLDPSVITYIMRKENISPDEMEKMLNKESGEYGISGISADFRDLLKAEAEGDEKAKLAIEAHNYSVAQYIAKMAVSMQGIDVIAFAAGIGENEYEIRKGICDNLKFMGVDLDEKENDQKRDEGLISTPDSKIKVYVIPTNEELMIARDTKRIVEKTK